MVLAVTILIASMIPAENVTCDSVDVIELNHFYDEEGRHVFDQYIYWDWCVDKWCGGQHHVVDWRLATKRTDMLPRRAVGGGFVQTWHDSGVLREVRSLSFSQTWSDYDRELVERDRLPVAERRGLR